MQLCNLMFGVSFNSALYTLIILISIKCCSILFVPNTLSSPYQYNIQHEVFSHKGLMFLERSFNYSEKCIFTIICQQKEKQ